MTTLLALLALAPGAAADQGLPLLDTYLDQAQPEHSFGRDIVLLGGPGKAILIGGLEPGLSSAPSPAAELSFRVLTGAPKVKSISVMRRPWREGAGRRGQVQTSLTSAGMSTWRAAIQGTTGWDAAGAAGPRDAEPIGGWTAEIQGGNMLVIKGLGAGEAALGKQALSYGYRIELETESALASSESREFGPKWSLASAAANPVTFVEISPRERMTPWPSNGAPLTWEAVIENKGSAATPASAVTWTLDGQAVATSQAAPVPPGGRATVSATIPFRAEPKDHRNGMLTVQLGGIATGTTYTNALAVGPRDSASIGLLPQAVAALNSMAAFSRFGFAQEGVRERFRFVSDPERAQALADPATDLAGSIRSILLSATRLSPSVATPPGGQPVWPASGALTWDTRDDGAWVPGLPLPEMGWASRFPELIPLAPSGMLGKAEAGILTALMHRLGSERDPQAVPTPSGLIVRCFNGSGNALRKIPMRVYQPDAAGEKGPVLFAGETMDTGVLFLTPNRFTPARAAILDPARSPWLLLEAGPEGVSESVMVPWTRLVEEGMRAPAAVATIEVRFMLASGRLDRNSDLAKNRPVQDSFGRFPAELSALVDGNPGTVVTMPPASDGQWIEIDLGRDRIIGEVELTFAGQPFRAFDIVVYKTAQSPEAATPFIREANSALRVLAQKAGGGATTTLRYRGETVLGRYIRLAPLAGVETGLAEVKVYPIQVADGAGVP